MSVFVSITCRIELDHPKLFLHEHSVGMFDATFFSVFAVLLCWGSYFHSYPKLCTTHYLFVPRQFQCRELFNCTSSTITVLKRTFTTTAVMTVQQLKYIFQDTIFFRLNLLQRCDAVTDMSSICLLCFGSANEIPDS